jgi:conserved oligomeric Golgi complex subunit 8
LALISEIQVKGDNAKYLKQYFELMREHLFAIFTQYRSIFSEDYGFATNQNTDNISVEGEALFCQNVLSSFALHITDHISETLHTHLPAIPYEDRQTRQSLLTQLLYCAQSLARVGCDFADVVIDAFFIDAEEEEEWVWQITNLHRQRMSKLLQTTV